MKFKLSILCLLIVFASACSVKERNYRNGYYVDWAFNKKEKKQNSDGSAFVNHSSVKPEQAQTNLFQNESADLLASNDPSSLNTIAQTSGKGLLLLSDTCGDQIIFKSGDIVAAKVLEITEDKIKYKRCDNIDGPLFVVSKSSVHSIKYANGTSEVIVPPAYNPSSADPSTKRSEYKGPQKVNPKVIFSVLAFLAGIFTVGIGFIVSLLLAQKAIKEINEEPKRWKGLALARFMKHLSIIILAIIAFVIVLAILSTL